MASEYRTLRILFAVPELDATGTGGSGSGSDADANDWLRLEQVEYVKPDIGSYGDYLSSIGAGGAHTLEEALINMAAYQSACDGDGAVEIEIQVHKSRGDLQYSITASYGTLSQQFTHESNKSKSITVKGTDSIDLDHMPTGAVSAEWEGSVIGEDGSILDQSPEISVDGETVSFGQKVVGTIRVEYRESHDTYILTISPRTEGYDANDPGSSFSSTVVAVWSGGTEILEIDVPEVGGNCSNGFGGSVSINPSDDEDDEDEERCVRRIEVRDPCTGDLISTREETIPCPE